MNDIYTKTIYIYERRCVVRRVRRSSFRLSRLVYRLLQFQELSFQRQRIKDKETRIIILTAFLSSSSTFIFFCWLESLWLPLLSLFSKKNPKPYTHTHFFHFFGYPPGAQQNGQDAMLEKVPSRVLCRIRWQKMLMLKASGSSGHLLYCDGQDEQVTLKLQEATRRRVNVG